MAEKTLTRNEFYKLAHECRDYSRRLATHDQDLVSSSLCREFNEFLARVRAYDRLRQPLAGLRPARGFTRAMLLSIILGLWLAFNLVGTRLVSVNASLIILASSTTLIIGVFLAPPSLYGTSVEAIEGRVLVVVQALQELLESGDMGFSEAAYFVARDVLRETADDLRQQVYLNRRAARP